MIVEVYNSVQGAAFFQRLLQEWREAGISVTPVEAISETDYRARRGPLGRLWLRWRMYVSYGWTCWRGGKGREAQETFRVVTTNPFFAPALVQAASGPSHTVVNLLYDLYPEALIQAGTTAPGSFLARRSAAVTRYALRECAATVFLGERLKAYAEATYGPARHAAVIPVGADGTPFRECPPAPLRKSAAPKIIYSGQMGAMHETDTLLAAWPKLSVGVDWLFHASGPGYARLRRALRADARATWGEPLADAEWQHAMKQTQVALVTIAPGAENVVMPSKTYSALVAGHAILAICRRTSDLADLVVAHECGWVVEPGDVEGLKAVVQAIAADPAGLLLKRQRAFAAGHRYYDMRPVAGQWMELLEKLRPALARKIPRSVGHLEGVSTGSKS